MPKIGIYLCKCGGMISENVDMDELLKATSKLEHVSTVKIHDLLCGDDGQKMLQEDIEKGLVDRIVTVACSHKMHQKTFTGVCDRAGMNPYLLHMVNIREQCIWMTTDKDQATEKAVRMMRAGVLRIVHQEALEQKEIEINPDVMVIGGGIAGVEATLELAKANRNVYLVEKEAAFGGMLPKLEHTYPSNECAPCILAPRMNDILGSEYIHLLTSTSIKNVVGFGGNFTVSVEERPRYVVPENCISCLLCIEECPAKAPNKFNSDQDERKAVDFPFPGCVPKAPYLDEDICLRFKGEECTKCKDVCDFDAIDYEQKPVEKKIEVGSIILAVGSKVYDAAKVYPQMRDGTSNVLDGLEFERLCSTTGPTKGKILMRDGNPPQSVAVIHCVGSRNEKHLPYCSGVCCKYALKHSHSIKTQLPDCDVTHIYSDLCIDGQKIQKMVTDLKSEGVNFLRCQPGENGLADLQKNNGKITVKGVDQKGETASLDVDMVLLAVGMAPNDELSKLVDQFSLSERGGYVVVQHEKISGVATTAEGVFLAGTVNGPKDITNSVNEAKAAVGEVLSTYIPGRKIKLEPMSAASDPDLCGKCRACITLCPYKAPYYDEEKEMIVVSEVLCKGCGTCVASCPSGAMKAKNFTKTQIKSEIKGVLE